MTLRGLHPGKGRSAEFRAGHRRAIRAAVTWLHEEASRMNDPRARDLLNGAGFGLGCAASRRISAKAERRD